MLGIFQTFLQEIGYLICLGGTSNALSFFFLLPQELVCLFFIVSNAYHSVNIGFAAFQEDSSTGDDSVHDKFIGPLPREGSVGSTSDYVSQSYSYSSILNKSETGKIYCYYCCYVFRKSQDVRRRIILEISSLASFYGLEN